MGQMGLGSLRSRVLMGANVQQFATSEDEKRKQEIEEARLAEEERRKKVAHGAWSKAKIGTKLGMHKREIHDEAEAARAIQLADELSKVAVEDRPRELLQIPLPAAVGALGAMSAEDRAATIAAMTDEERWKILGGMSAEDRADAERVQEAIEEEARRVQAEKEAEARR